MHCGEIIASSINGVDVEVTSYDEVDVVLKTLELIEDQ